MTTRMLSPLLEARYHWERGEQAPGLQRLNDVLADGGAQAFYLTRTEVEAYAPLSFENAVTTLLLEEGPLRLPWDVAFERLWRALPAQYLILLLTQRSLDPVRDARIRDVLLEAAAQGVLSERAEDYDVSGRGVVTPDAHPELVGFLGGEDFLTTVRRAEEEDAWRRYLALRPERVLSLFMYAVFHKERALLGEMVLIRLVRIADCHEPFLRAFTAQLGAVPVDTSVHAELVSSGMRLAEARDPTACLRDFHEAVVTRRFEEFVARYYPG